MLEKANIADLKLDNSAWPRSTLDEEAIERYRDCLEELPPDEPLPGGGCNSYVTVDM